MVEQVDAKKERIDAEGAIKLARAATDVWAAKGKKIVHFKMSEKPTDEELVKAMVGPSGNLRAPTIRRGKKIFVGFHDEELAGFLG